MIKAELLTIGDEILYGQIIDSNSQWMSVELTRAGIRVIRKTSVGDNEADILKAFAEAEERADIVLITGGLGPTSDDLTKPCLARYYGCDMQIHSEALEEVTAFFKSRGRELTELNRLQASLPVCCEKVTNRLGTAPGMWFARNGKVMVSMPGVPHEMKEMMSRIVIPRLVREFHPPVILHTIVRTIGIGESFLAEKIKDWEQSLPPHIGLAYLPSAGQVKLRLTATGKEEAALRADSAALVERLAPLLGEYIFGVGESELEAVLGETLAARGLTVAAAESCTGGYLSHLITSVPGSSRYFKGSVIAYDNAVKAGALGVDEALLEKHGAVSEEVVVAMAQAVRNRLGASFGVATSGVAGPGGGTPEKPVGTVWIACADERTTTSKLLKLSQDRQFNIRMASLMTLNLIRLSLPRAE